MSSAAVSGAGSRTASERGLLERAFSRAAGGPLVTGNSVRLLRNAAENYPAWLDAIAAAEGTIHFETYIIWDDAAGATFADALSAKARAVSEEPVGTSVSPGRPPPPYWICSAGVSGVSASAASAGTAAGVAMAPFLSQ